MFWIVWVTVNLWKSTHGFSLSFYWTVNWVTSAEYTESLLNLRFHTHVA